MQQQSLSTAIMESLQASARYQALIQRANVEGMQRLQDKLTEHAEPGRQIDSLKALYDLWVDATEAAYAEIALTDEFREAYGDMINTQMRVRQLQQQQTEQLCQQLGMPTRSEVSSLGERLQALRREFRASQPAPADDHGDEIMALRRELTALKRQLAADKPVPVVAKKTAPAKPATLAVKKSAVRKAVASKPPEKPARKAAASKTKAVAKPHTRPRKS